MLVFSFRKEKLESSKLPLWVARGENGVMLGSWKNYKDGLTCFRNKNWSYESYDDCVKRVKSSSEFRLLTN
jgi:hypothetical protein